MIRHPIAARAVALAIRTLIVAPLLAWTLTPLPIAKGGDWPQILGPNRNGQALDEKPIRAWKGTTVPQSWSVEVGQGYAGPAVQGDRVVLFHRVGNRERVQAWQAKTGDPLWQTDFKTLYEGGVNPDTGPRCVPLIHKDSVYLFGAAGTLHRVALTTGKTLWTRNAYQTFRGDEGFFGAGSTPIVVEDKLIVNIGGRQNAGIVAFHLDSGETAWQATDEGASYSSPTVAVIDGQPVVIFVTRLNTVGIDPRNGKVMFRFAYGRSGPTVNAATPLVFDNHLFVSSSYGVGAKLALLSADGPRVVWENDEVMSSQYTTCVYHQGFLYGAHGREDYANGELRCVEAKSGKLRWKTSEVGVAHVILIHNHLLALDIDGTLTLVEANSEKYRPVAETNVSDHLTRALPAYANGRFYFRDNQGKSGRLRCFVINE